MMGETVAPSWNALLHQGFAGLSAYEGISAFASARVYVNPWSSTKADKINVFGV